jgi:hypothetical protein
MAGEAERLEQLFDVGPRYTELSLVGRGAYGIVWFAVDDVRDHSPS